MTQLISKIRGLWMTFDRQTTSPKEGCLDPPPSHFYSLRHARDQIWHNINATHPRVDPSSRRKPSCLEGFFASLCTRLPGRADHQKQSGKEQHWSSNYCFFGFRVAMFWFPNVYCERASFLRDVQDPDQHECIVQYDGVLFY